jgi:hypothetical protein
MREVYADAQGEITGKHIMATMERAGFSCSQSVTSRAKTLLRLEKYGSYEDGFKAVRQIAIRIVEANPQAIAIVKFDDSDALKQVFQGFFLMLPYAVVSAFSLNQSSIHK